MTVRTITLGDVELGTITHTPGDHWYRVAETGTDFAERYPCARSAETILTQRFRLRIEQAARELAQRAVADEIAYANAVEEDSAARIAELEHRLAELEK